MPFDPKHNDAALNRSLLAQALRNPATDRVAWDFASGRRCALNDARGLGFDAREDLGLTRWQFSGIFGIYFLDDIEAPYRQLYNVGHRREVTPAMVADALGAIGR
jgi:hypothetical protein